MDIKLTYDQIVILIDIVEDRIVKKAKVLGSCDTLRDINFETIVFELYQTIQIKKTLGEAKAEMDI